MTGANKQPLNAVVRPKAKSQPRTLPQLRFKFKLNFTDPAPEPILGFNCGKSGQSSGCKMCGWIKHIKWVFLWQPKASQVGPGFYNAQLPHESLRVVKRKRYVIEQMRVCVQVETFEMFYTFVLVPADADLWLSTAI